MAVDSLADNTVRLMADKVLLYSCLQINKTKDGDIAP